MKKSILSLSAAVALGGLGFAGAANAIAVFDTDGAAGGVVVLHPAGTGHQGLWASHDLVVIGAYPKGGRFDLCRGSKAEREKALTTIPSVPRPDSDPVYGKNGPLLTLWR